jgi:hypothetical protein
VKRLALIALAIAVAGCGGGAKPHAFRVVSKLDAEYVDHYRLVWTDSKHARPVQLGTYVQERMRSPDGRMVVFGGDLQFVDLVHRRKAWAPKVADGCDVEPVLWSRVDRVVLRMWCGSAHLTNRSDILVADPLARRFVGRRGIGILVGGLFRTHGSAILLGSPPLGPPVDGIRDERLGRARLMVIRPSGTIDETRLPVRAGFADSRTFNRVPAFLVHGRHAYVIGEGDGVARVDLRTLRIDWHRLPHAFDAQPALHDKPQPHMGTTNPSRDLDRQAVWLGNAKIAVTGSDTWSPLGYDRHAPAGLKILDVRRWTARTVDPHVSNVVLAGRRLLATGPGVGLAEYDPAGRLLFHAFDGKMLWVSSVRGHLVRVTDGRNNDVVRVP